jgi:hypothetical protein
MKTKMMILFLLLASQVHAQSDSKGGGGGVNEDGSAPNFSRINALSLEAKLIYTALKADEHRDPNSEDIGYKIIRKSVANLDCTYIQILGGDTQPEEYSCALKLHRTKTSAKEIYQALNIQPVRELYQELPEFLKSTKTAGPLTCIFEEHSNFSNPDRSQDKYSCNFAF